MSGSQPRRGSILKWVGALVLGFVLSTGYLVWDAFRSSREIIRRCEADWVQFFASLRAKELQRPPLFETQIPGNAWDSYRNGFDVISAALGIGQGRYPLEITHWKAVDDQSFGVLLVRSRPALNHFISGLKSARSVPPFHYEEGELMDRDLRLLTLLTARFFEEAAKRYHTTGQDREAINTLFLTLAMERDVSRRGGTRFLSVLRMVEWEVAEILQTILAKYNLQAAELEQICGVFDKLERARPSVREELEIRLMMEPMDREGDRNCRPGLKRLYSKNLHRADSLSQYADVMRRLDQIFSLPPEHRANEAVRRKEQSEKPGSGDEALAWDMVSTVCYQDVFTTLNFTLFRVALGLAWYHSEKGGFPGKLEDIIPRYLEKVPKCPFTGTALGYVPGKIWSIGFDGKDDGGKSILKTDEHYSDIGTTWWPIPGDVVWIVQKQ